MDLRRDLRGDWRGAVERAVAGLGFDPVEVEHVAGGLLRVTIDRLPQPAGTVGAADPDASVSVDDCEKVTRQLQYVLDVEGIEYQRLEVSSPGLDRPLKRPADWDRFAGSDIELQLKAPLAGRRRFTGRLERRDAGAGSVDRWRLVFSDGKGEQALDFSLDEVRAARLVPAIDFKGRRGRGEAARKGGGAT